MTYCASSSQNENPQQPGHDAEIFSGLQSANPNSPLPALQLGVQLADLQTSKTELRDAIMDIHRSDGALVNCIVTEDSLDENLIETLTASTGADEVTASAAATAASAAAAATSAATLASEFAVIEDLGALGDWGLITEAVGETLDYGDLS